jgi:hypothetical protein
MSRPARDWVWGSCRGLTPAVRSLLLALAEHADEGGRCWPSLSRLSRVTELDRRTVTRGLEELEARAFLTRERRPGESTCYQLLLDRPRPGGERTRAPAPATAPRDQGPATPGGVTPPGARDPRSRGVVPLARGETPPDGGASDPPNRHRTESEPSVCAGDGPNIHPAVNIPAHGANCVKGIPDCFCQVGNAAS